MSPRACGECAACCTYLHIDDLPWTPSKPAGERCREASCAGCAIYDRRPKSCRDFRCSWLMETGLPEEFRPDRSGYLLYSDDGKRLIALRFRKHREPSGLHDLLVSIARGGVPVCILSTTSRLGTMLHPGSALPEKVEAAWSHPTTYRFDRRRHP